MTQPITSKTDLELGELQTKHCILQDELAAKEKELADFKAEASRALKRAKKQAPPVDCMIDPMPPPTVVGHPSQNQQQSPYLINNHVHIGNGATSPSIDPGVDPNTDPIVEHAIAQAAANMRQLADMARESNRHKTAAQEGWATVRALQQYTAYNPPAPGMLYHNAQHMGHNSFIG